MIRCSQPFLLSLLCCLGVDFHWYRLDDNERWSHKPGPSPATIYDGMGKLIYGPRKAANSKHGPHYKFVAFMEIFTNIIDGPDGPHSSKATDLLYPAKALT